MSAVHNEQTKLLATAINNGAVAYAVINNGAVAYAVIGFVTPITAISFGVATAPILRPWTVFFAAIWLCAAIGLHWTARHVLRSLRP